MYSPNNPEADPTRHPCEGGIPAAAPSIPAAPSFPGMDALIRLDEVTKRYDSDAAPAVDGVSMRIAPGEAIAVMGPSAAGNRRC
jgi:ABC-type bacteriocin/lantibiotic exporter with double-glycine peptidase domain